MKIKLPTEKIKALIGDKFSIKSFVISLAVLFLLFFLSSGIFLGGFAKVEERAKPSGKIMVTLTAPDEIPPEQVETKTPEIKPHPVENEAKEDPHSEVDNHPPQPVDPHATHATEESHQVSPSQETPPLNSEPVAEENLTIEDSVAGLSEETEQGSLPIIRTSDGLTPFDAYKSPFKLKADTKAVISLVMVDFGLSETTSKEAIEKLPFGTSFVANPFAENLQSKISEARIKGKEIWMQIPVSGTGEFEHLDMGPNAILSGVNSNENIDRLRKHLGRATGYTGAAFTVSPNFKENDANLVPLLDFMLKRGLGLVQIDPKDTIINNTVANLPARFVQSSLWIDRNPSAEQIKKSLDEAKNKALVTGYLVVGFRATPYEFPIIQEWAKTLAAQNIQLAPLSFTSKQNMMSINHTTPAKAEQSSAPSATSTATTPSHHD